MTVNKHHWEDVFTTRPPDEVGWYQQYPGVSLEMLSRVGAQPSNSIIDVGCGTSFLVDQLLEQGYRDITLLDLSHEALDIVRQRLGSKADIPTCLCGDITQIRFERQFDIWHDRAAFHFLTEENERRHYMDNLDSSLTGEGWAIIGTFSPSGPTSCSGLEIVQYNEVSFERELPRSLELVEALPHTHLTPAGREQDYLYFLVRRSSG